MFSTIKSARDMALGVSPWVPGQRKYGLNSLTTEEISNALAGDVSGAKLDALEIEMDSMGTTDRARLLLQWNAAGIAAGLPRSAFAKGTSTTTSSRMIVSAFGCHTYEARFFNEMYESLSDLTIKPLASRSGIGGRYVVAFEDLALTEGVEFYNADSIASKAHAEAMIDLFAKLHGRFWRSPRFKTDLSWVKTYANRPGYPFMKHSFKFAEKKFMAQDRVVPDEVRRLTKTYVNNQKALVRVWEAMPQTLCHGDCHLGNTYTKPDGGAGIYDWQVFHKMNGLRDFAYFMMHSIPTELRRAEEKNLLRRYLAALAEEGAGLEVPNFDQAWNDYRLLTVDGWIIIAWTLAFGGMQPDDRMEVTCERAINSIVDLELENILNKTLNR